MRYHAVTRTDLGWVAVLQTEAGVRHITLPKVTPEEALAELGTEEGDLGEENPQALAGLLERLRAFYAGQPVTFEGVPLDLRGRPPFARAVWEHLRLLPRGQVRTYGELARAVGRPRAARAVGQAMAANPVPPIVPCHRVIGRGGRLTGFGGGLELKARMLQMEGVTITGR